MSHYPNYTCPIKYNCLPFDYKNCDMNFISGGNIKKTQRQIENEPINRSILLLNNNCKSLNNDITCKLNDSCRNKNNSDYKFNKYSAKKWSNVIGYGNISVNSHDDERNIHTDIHPYNRINKLNKPYNIKNVNEEAWELNKIKKIY